MARAAVQGLNYEFKFPKGPAIQTYVGDITEAKADVLVVPEGVSFSGLGYIGRQMMELSPKFGTNRQKLMREKNLAAWETYTSTLGGKPFRHVIHTIAVPCPKDHVEMWSSRMHLLYQRIFQEADRKVATVLAVPLLGTGRGGGRIEDTIEAAVNSVANFKQTNLKRILFVSNEEEIVCQIASRCDWELAHGGTGQKWRPLKNEADVTYGDTKVHNRVQDKSKKKSESSKQWGSRPYSSGVRSESSKQRPKTAAESSHHTDNSSVHGGRKLSVNGFANISKTGKPVRQGLKKSTNTKTEENAISQGGRARQNGHSLIENRSTFYEQRSNYDFDKDYIRSIEPSSMPKNHYPDVSKEWECQIQQKQQSRRDKGRENAKVPAVFENETVGDNFEGMFERQNYDQKAGSEIHHRQKHNELKRLNDIIDHTRFQQEEVFIDESDENDVGDENDEDGVSSVSYDDNDDDEKNYTRTSADHFVPKFEGTSESFRDTNMVKQRERRPDGSTGFELNQMSKLDQLEHQHLLQTMELKSKSPSLEKDFGRSQLSGTPKEKELRENGFPDVMDHGARPKEKKGRTEVIHQPTEGGRENYETHLHKTSKPKPYQPSETERLSNFTESKSKSSFLEQDLTKVLGPLTLSDTFQGEELREGDMSLSKDHGQRPKENKKKEQTADSSGKDMCPICICEITDPKILNKCGHVFCRDCIDNSFKQFKPMCPNCNMVYGEIRGNQPDGQMGVVFSAEHLPGYEGHGTITITYYFPDGTQGVDHPNPGQCYEGTTCRAYLPDNKEGKVVLKLLRKAFDRKMTFTIGRSTTTGQENVVTWNNIHHKTNKDGGPTRSGYPDTTYLQRVRKELASKGVTDDNRLTSVHTENETPMILGNPGETTTKDTRFARFEQLSLVPALTKEEEKQRRFKNEVKKLKELAGKKGLKLKETGDEQDILASLSEQLTHVLNEKIEPGHLRAEVARYLRTQSDKENNLISFLTGPKKEHVITSIEEGGNVDCQILLSAASNSFGVEILLVSVSGEEILFQPFREKEFLPSLALGIMSNAVFYSLERIKDLVASDKPPTWSRSSKDTELVTLRADTEEYKEVEQNFFSSIGKSKNYSVIQIKRVQSITQWRCYKITRDQLAQRYPDMTTEKLLWHGTSETAIKPICKEGFNRSHCGKNATRFGNGVYFSKASGYAAEDTYSVPDSDGFKHVFRARVLTGHFTKGQSGMKVPPLLDEKDLVRFDSVVDNVERPNLFVIFHDNKAYPEYLIKFH